jgi:hypothetical protein
MGSVSVKIRPLDNANVSMVVRWLCVDFASCGDAARVKLSHEMPIGGRRFEQAMHPMRDEGNLGYDAWSFTPVIDFYEHSHFKYSRKKRTTAHLATRA